MPSKHTYANILRALGQVLDEQQARNLEVLAHEVFLAVSFDVAGQDAAGVREQRAFNEFDLHSLGEQGKRLRSQVITEGEQSERLRTLGQDLDAAGITLGNLTEEEDTYHVRGSAAGRYVDQVFSFEELRTESARRRRLRRPPVPVAAQPVPPRPRGRWPFGRRSS